jgi:hypothetical protein
MVALGTVAYPARASGLSRFFTTIQGEHGDGDEFFELAASEPICERRVAMLSRASGHLTPGQRIHYRSLR